MTKKDQTPFHSIRQLSCEQVDNLVTDYLDETLDPVLKRRFELHLQVCSACSGVVSDCEVISTVGKTLDEVPIPKDVSLRLRDALRKVGFEPNTGKPQLTLVSKPKE